MDKSTFADAQTDAVPSSDEDSQPDTSPPHGQDLQARLKDDVIAAIKTCYDPEIPVDVYELGLIYEIDVRDEGVVYVKMTLTSPMCPVAEILPIEVEEKARSVEGISRVDLDLVWDPPWDIEMMSESARLELNF
jgi:FeS assembly SUF system protein